MIALFAELIHPATACHRPTCLSIAGRHLQDRSRIPARNQFWVRFFREFSGKGNRARRWCCYIKGQPEESHGGEAFGEAAAMTPMQCEEGAENCQQQQGDRQRLRCRLTYRQRWGSALDGSATEPMEALCKGLAGKLNYALGTAAGRRCLDDESLGRHEDEMGTKVRMPWRRLSPPTDKRENKPQNDYQERIGPTRSLAGRTAIL